jgi:hypothetical protein
MFLAIGVKLLQSTSLVSSLLWHPSCTMKQKSKTYHIENNRKLFWAYVLICFSIIAAYSINIGSTIFANSDSLTINEHHHHFLNSAYKASWGITIQSNDDMFLYGPINTTPNLYNIISGKLAYLGYFKIEDIRFWRLLSLILGALILVTIIEITTELELSKWAGILALVSLSTLPAFITSSSSIASDNFICLLSSRMLLYFVRIMKSGGLGNLLGCAIYLLAGSLSSYRILPLFLIIGLGIISVLPSLLQTIDVNLATGLKIHERFSMTIFLLLFFASALFYGSNVYKYNSIHPSLIDVIGREKAMSSSPQLQKEQDLLGNTEQKSKISIIDFTKETIRSIKNSSFETNKKPFLFPYALLPIAISSVVICVQLFRGKEFYIRHIWSVIALGSTTIFYISFIFFKSFLTNQNFRSIEYVLNSSFLFPVLVPLVLFFSALSLASKSKFWRFVVTLWIAFVFYSTNYYLTTWTGHF